MSNKSAADISVATATILLSTAQSLQTAYANQITSLQGDLDLIQEQLNANNC